MQQEALILAQQARLEHYRQYDDYLAWFEKQRLRCWFKDDVFHMVNGSLGYRIEITRNAIRIQTPSNKYGFSLINLIIQRDRNNACRSSCGLFATLSESAARQEIFTIDIDIHDLDRAYILSPFRTSDTCFAGHCAEFARELDKAAATWGIPRLHVYGDSRTCIERGETCCTKLV